ncbi:MAG: hypothetical protein BIFFINMI_02066 [Phycisphaerae bacterium]|nr:hypothetical protein [Phycisphaerae bacterium]
MDSTFRLRVRAAAAAGWWTALVFLLVMMATWLAWLGISTGRPDWILRLWGSPDITWERVQTLVLEFYAILKLLLWLWVLFTAWLTIWARRLKAAERAAAA